jgi:hypothetical protein
MPITTAACKAKSRKLQQFARDKILSLHPTFRPEDCKSTPMGVQGPDVQLSPFITDVLPIQVECKSYAKIAVYKWYEQAKSHGKFEPVLFVKQNNSKPLAIVDAEHYMSLLKLMIEDKLK